MLRPDEVKNREARLVLGQPQAPAKLLQEHGGALRRPEEQHGVDRRDVEALVEQVDGEDVCEVMARLGMPAALKRCAMNSACWMLTQKPRARILPGFSTLSCTACRISRTR